MSGLPLQNLDAEHFDAAVVSKIRSFPRDTEWHLEGSAYFVGEGHEFVVDGSVYVVTNVYQTDWRFERYYTVRRRS